MEMSLPSSPAPHLRVGREGESVARTYLESKGYAVSAQNVRIGSHLEIDLIARDPVDDVLVFVEVKARSHLYADYRPERTAGIGKRRNIRRAARMWVAKNKYEGGYRVDLICVVDGKVTFHFQELAWR